MKLGGDNFALVPIEKWGYLMKQDTAGNKWAKRMFHINANGLLTYYDDSKSSKEIVSKKYEDLAEYTLIKTVVGETSSSLMPSPEPNLNQIWLWSPDRVFKLEVIDTRDRSVSKKVISLSLHRLRSQLVTFEHVSY